MLYNGRNAFLRYYCFLLVQALEILQSIILLTTSNYSLNRDLGAKIADNMDQRP